MVSTGSYSKATECPTPHLSPSRDTAGGSDIEQNAALKAGGEPFQNSVFSAVRYTRVLAKLSMAALDNNATHLFSHALVAWPLSTAGACSALAVLFLSILKYFVVCPESRCEGSLFLFK